MILEKHLYQARPATDDSEALREWVFRHHDDIYRFLNHLTRHRETAEDLAQQTFVNAYQALKGFREEASMRTWLHRIAFRDLFSRTVRLRRLRGRQGPVQRPLCPALRSEGVDQARSAIADRWLQRPCSRR